jgi:hypothetical protein
VLVAFDNGQLVRVALSAKRGDNYVDVTTLHYSLDDGADFTHNSAQSLADTFRDNVLASYKALFTNNWTIQPVTVHDEKDPLHPDRLRSAWTSGAPVAGTRASSGDYLHPAVCGVATLRTDHIGRRYRGRMFMPGGLLEGDINDLAFNGSINGLWATFLAAIPRQPDIAPPLSNATAHWCVYSRTNRAAGVATYAEKITSVDLHTSIHWLRSRAHAG